MSTHKNIDVICVVAVVFSMLLAVICIYISPGKDMQLGTSMGYENRLFDTSKVHTIDIVMDDWDSFIETCDNEEHAVCAVVIDGESYKNV